MKRARSDALYVGITGSSGKSTTTALLSHILETTGVVHDQIYENTLHPLASTIRNVPADARFVVVEVGATVKGSILPMANLLRPDVAIVTKAGLEHYSAFRSKEAVASEKGALVEALHGSGLAILNADDANVMAIAVRCKAQVVTFGRSSEADYCILDAQASLPGRLTVRMRCKKGTFEISTPFVGEDFWLATAAAFSAAVELGADPVVAATRIANFAPPWNRCGLISHAEGPTFIVDTVKAPNESIPSAIRIVQQAQAAHKRVVVGHISDYTGGPRKGYPLAYQLSAACADQVIFVGEYGHRARATDEDRKSGKFVDFLSPQEASDHIKQTARRGELILLKGSQKLHLERIALSWTHDVRCWEINCGKFIDCLQCGLVETPYAEHGRARRAKRRRPFGL